jgi:hypothetical protein
MYYEPKKLDRYLIRDLQRMDEKDSIDAMGILQRRLSGMKNENYYLEILIEELPLSTKASILLTQTGMITVTDVIHTGFDNLRRIRGMGPMTLMEIKSLMEKLVERKDAIKGLAGLDLRYALTH